MEITKEILSNQAIVKLTGRLDTTNYNKLDSELDSLMNEGQVKLLIDCTDLNYISSSGLRVFLVYLKRVKSSEGSLSIFGMQPMIEEIFRISGFTSLFTIHSTREEALAAK